MKVEYTAAARREFIEAAEYYAAEKPELGDEFCEEVQQAIKRVLEFPVAWTTISPRTHRCRTRRFPYGIIYQMSERGLLIVAVMHLHRSPRAWESRLPRPKRSSE